MTAGYRGEGLRGKKQTASGATYFLFDGTNPVVEMDSTGSVAATNTFSTRGVVSRRVSAVSVLYAFDSEGNVSQRTDASGTVLSNHLFAAHGVNVSGGLSDPFGYKAQFGYYSDTETGLQLLTNRYYDASTGRFLTRDPISYSGGINLYAYVQNSPTGFIDPLGLELQYERLREVFKNMPQQSGPSTYDTFFGDGGIFTGQTLEEFISAKERARQPCKPFGERWLNSFSETNQAIPGSAAPIGTTLITAPGAAQITGQPGLVGWAWRGGGPGLGASIAQSAATGLATHASFEGGIAVGSLINAFGCVCGY
jgi:RHS repeat-associated protein